MAKVKSITVGFKYTRNMGNYESMVANASAEVELEEGDKVDKVYSDAWEMVKEEVRTQLFGKAEDNVDDLLGDSEKDFNGGDSDDS